MTTNTLSIDNLFNLRDKIALITGGTSGLGLIFAQAYLQAGAQVFITSRKADACEKTVRELSPYGHIESLPTDISTSEGREALKHWIAEKTDHLDILVNNAGNTWGEDFDQYPDSAFDRIFDLNVKALFALTRDLTPHLCKRASEFNCSRVINIGSMDGLHVNTAHGTGTFAYSASKAAVHHLTRSLAVELAPRHILVNAIAPGFFHSKMTNGVVQDQIDDINGRCALNRVGRPEEIAGAALFLASTASGYCTGSILTVDGGSSIKHR